MILVAFWHGLRASEVVQITPDHLRDGYLDIQRLKGSERTRQRLVEHAEPLLNERDALLEFTRGMAGNQKLFPIGRKHFWRLVQRYGAQAGIPHFKAHPHALKHTLGTQLAKRIPLNEVQKRLGHRSLDSTGIYTKVSDEIADDSTARALGSPDALID